MSNRAMKAIKVLTSLRRSCYFRAAQTLFNKRQSCYFFQFTNPLQHELKKKKDTVTEIASKTSRFALCQIFPYKNKSKITRQDARPQHEHVTRKVSIGSIVTVRTTVHTPENYFIPQVSAPLIHQIYTSLPSRGYIDKVYYTQSSYRTIRTINQPTSYNRLVVC